MRRIVFCLVAATLTIAPAYAQTDALERADVLVEVLNGCRVNQHLLGLLRTCDRYRLPRHGLATERSGSGWTTDRGSALDTPGFSAVVAITDIKAFGCN